MSSCSPSRCENSCFIKSPIYDNWIKLNKPKQSLLICSPYFKNYSIEKIISNYRLYEVNCPIDLEILIRGRLEDFIQGSSDISALESLLRLDNLDLDKVNRVTNLHMKAYLIDEKKLLIGSGNCTKRGLFVKGALGNVEGSICTTSEKIIRNFNEYYTNIKMQSESLDTFYDKIVNEYNKYIESNKVNRSIVNMISSTIKKDETKSEYSFKQHRDMSSIDNTIIENTELSAISISDIPQYSNFYNGTYKLTEILIQNGDRGLSFYQLGICLQGKRSEYANKKYGENHAKLGELLDLVVITSTRPRKIYLTKLGKVFYEANESKKVEILKSQIFRTAIVRDIIQKSNYGSFNLLEYLSKHLALSTAKRRMSNVKNLLYFLKENGIHEINDIINKL